MHVVCFTVFYPCLNMSQPFSTTLPLSHGFTWFHDVSPRWWPWVPGRVCASTRRCATVAKVDIWTIFVAGHLRFQQIPQIPQILRRTTMKLRHIVDAMILMCQIYKWTMRMYKLCMYHVYGLVWSIITYVYCILMYTVYIYIYIYIHIILYNAMSCWFIFISVYP